MLDSIRKGIANYLLLVLVPALAAFFYIYDPADSSNQHLFLTCLFHKTTGLYCPGCGGQRAVHQLLHGNIHQAAHYNLLLVLSLPLLVWSGVLYIRNAFAREKRQMLFLYYPLTTRFLLAVILLFWILRNIPFSPFDQLAP
jgi:hypothetical protein